jgi:hypothetical protein
MSRKARAGLQITYVNVVATVFPLQVLGIQEIPQDSEILFCCNVLAIDIWQIIPTCVLAFLANVLWNTIYPSGKGELKSKPYTNSS